MAAVSDPFRLILDSSAESFVFGPQDWKAVTSTQWYGGGALFPEFALGATEFSSPDSFGSFSLTFEGISVSFVGSTPPPPSLQSIRVTIDDNAPYISTYGDPTPPSYMMWYRSPILDEGRHTILVEQLAGTFLDYAIITAGSSTPLAETTAIVDNTDPSVQYTGGWSLNTDQFDSGSVPDGSSYFNSTHRASMIGEAVRFTFQGTSLGIYGTFSWFNLGVLSMAYDLDGSIRPQTYAVTASSPEYMSYYGESPNFPFMVYDNLPPGKHTLTINITRCMNQTFILDYFTYSPSFATPPEKGDPAVIPFPSTLPTMFPAPATRLPAATATTSPSSERTSPPSPGVQRSTGMPSIPALVMVPIAIGLFFLVVIVCALWSRVRRLKKFSTVEDKDLPPSSRSFLPDMNGRRRPLPALPDRVPVYGQQGRLSLVIPFPVDRPFIGAGSIYSVGKERSNSPWSKSATVSPASMEAGYASISPLRRTPFARLNNVVDGRRSKPPPYSTKSRNGSINTPLLT